MPLGVTLGLLVGSLLCEAIGFTLYRASHNERDKMMTNNGKQIQTSLNNCMDLYKSYGIVETDEISQRGIKNIEDLKNLQLLNKHDAKKQLSKIDGLKHECKHNHKKSNHRSKHIHVCRDHNNRNHKQNTVKLGDLLTNKSQLHHTHIHHPKGVLGKPITAYSNITQGVSKGVSNCLVRKQNKVTPMQNAEIGIS